MNGNEGWLQCSKPQGMCLTEDAAIAEFSSADYSDRLAFHYQPDYIQGRNVEAMRVSARDRGIVSRDAEEWFRCFSDLHH